MAVVSYLLTRTGTPDRNGDIDGVQAMILAIDNAVDTSTALILARGTTVLNTAGIAAPTGYFDTATALSTFDAAGDRAIFGAHLATTIA